jgi:hypothetical protein
MESNGWMESNHCRMDCAKEEAEGSRELGKEGIGTFHYLG